MAKSNRLLSLALLIFIPVFSLTQSAAVSADEVKWSRVNIPSEGNAGNWLLASGSDVQHLAKPPFITPLPPASTVPPMAVRNLSSLP